MLHKYFLHYTFYIFTEIPKEHQDVLTKVNNSFRKEGDFYVWGQEFGPMKKENKFKSGVEFDGEGLAGNKYKVNQLNQLNCSIIIS